MLTRLPVHQALALRAFDRSNGAFNIAAAERNPVIVAEVELRQIPMQVLLAAVLIDAIHAAFEDREVAFDRIGGHVAGAFHQRHHGTLV